MFTRPSLTATSGRGRARQPRDQDRDGIACPASLARGKPRVRTRKLRKCGAVGEEPILLLSTSNSQCRAWRHRRALVIALLLLHLVLCRRTHDNLADIDVLGLLDRERDRA